MGERSQKRGGDLQLTKPFIAHGTIRGLVRRSYCYPKRPKLLPVQGHIASEGEDKKKLVS